jgi:hypothetical protein
MKVNEEAEKIQFYFLRWRVPNSGKDKYNGMTKEILGKEV